MYFTVAGTESHDHPITYVYVFCTCEFLQGLVACGGESGLLKIIKADNTTRNCNSISKGVSSLASNQTLRGHSGRVTCCAWNITCEKLASADDNGLIIVWTLEDDVWCEEMINNREESFVKDLKWTNSGDRICIIYFDGAVIVGSVEGTKIWGKEFGVPLNLLLWSPDGTNILFLTTKNELKVYDVHGNYLKDMVLNNTPTEENEHDDIVALDWYSGANGYFSKRAADIVIALRNGCIHLTRGIGDIFPITVETNMTISSCKWNSNGHILAIGGFTGKLDGNQSSRKNIVKFFDPSGTHLYSLKIPGTDIVSDVTWEGSSPRLALAVGSCIYFINVRPQYKWTTFGSNLIYAFIKGRMLLLGPIMCR